MLRPAPESQTKFRMCKFLETFGSSHHQNAKHGVLTIVPTTHESSRGLYLPLWDRVVWSGVCQSIALSGEPWDHTRGSNLHRQPSDIGPLSRRI